MPIIKINRANIDYEIVGSGRPMLLVHGYLGGKQSWKNQIPAFSQKYKLIVPSLRGRGDSDKPDSGYTLKDQADDLHVLLEKLISEPAIVMGHSMGGIVAQQFCLDYPNQVAALILSGTYSGPLVGQLGGPDTIDAYIEKINEMGMEGYFRWFLSNFIFSPGTSQEKIESSLFEILKTPKKVAIALLEGRRDFDFTTRLKEIKVPSLVIACDQDNRAPLADQERMNRLIPNCWLKIIKGVGHSGLKERSEEYNQAVLNFLDILAKT